MKYYSYVITNQSKEQSESSIKTADTRVKNGK